MVTPAAISIVLFITESGFRSHISNDGIHAFIIILRKSAFTSFQKIVRSKVLIDRMNCVLYVLGKWILVLVVLQCVSFAFAFFHEHHSLEQFSCCGVLSVEILWRYVAHIAFFISLLFTFLLIASP